MAKDKKSFILYADLIETVKELDDKTAGLLFRHILNYVNGNKPTQTNAIVKLAFIPIKQQLKRDLEKWEKQQQQRKAAGKRSAEVRQRNATTVNERSISSTVNVTGTVTGTVIKDNTIDIRKLKFAETLKPYLEKYGKEMLNDFFGYWTEPNKSNTKFRQELQRTWSLSRRLSTWSANNNNFHKQQKQSTVSSPNQNHGNPKDLYE